MKDIDKSPSSSNRSTEKALAIIEYLSTCNEPSRLLDIAAALNLNTSTASRFLSSLQNCGYVQQEPDSQKYHLTYKICQIANRISTGLDMYKITHPYLIDITRLFQESACISIERDMRMVYVDVCTGPDKSLMSMQKIGNVVPMHCTGNGKLVLLSFTGEKLEALISDGLEQFTKNTITTKEALLEELRLTESRGYAVDNEECELGVRCVACPIRNYTGAIIAGISVTGPASRFSILKINEHLPLLQKAAQAISLQLGFEPNN